uniref:Uncharacterized protein n=1 Tax=Anguilla anguilla TaxID=7936 RepID=A0A0E9SHD8_ANGAN
MMLLAPEHVLRSYDSMQMRLNFRPWAIYTELEHKVTCQQIISQLDEIKEA